MDLVQAEIVNLYKKDDKWFVKTKLEAVYSATCVILATGTFLSGRIYVGDVSFESGPDGLFPAKELGEAVRSLGLPIRRFKTGTPSRVNRRSIDFSKMEEQKGDTDLVHFSFDPQGEIENKISCHITYTNEKTKQIILDNLDRSPMYSGKI